MKHLFLPQIHLGGMCFDMVLQRGVKKKHIPSPMVFFLPSNASYDVVIQKGVEYFFPESTTSVNEFCLVDSNGIPYKCDKSDWVLSEFIKSTGYPPSKIHLYVMWQPKVVYIQYQYGCLTSPTHFKPPTCTIHYCTVDSITLVRG